MWIIRWFFYFILIIATLLLSVTGYYAKLCFDYKNPKDATVMIAKGASVRFVANTLEKQEVIRDQFIFEAYLRIVGKAAKIKAGEYVFETGLGMSAVIDKLIEGKVRLRQFTIPEGYTITDVCRLLAEKEIMGKAACETRARGGTLLSEAPGAVSSEGFLFPDTYSYDADVAPDQLFKAMTDLFFKKVGEERIAQAKAKGFGLLQLVTFASVVEKETGLASERPLIAGVFYNRLKIGMPLQSDPTTIYGLSHFNGNLTRADLERDSPYNTYTRQGLPVGPICNPGLAAIDAVLNPAPTEALYFVAKGDGSHYFSKTLEEHNNAVRYFQLHQGSAPTP